MTSDDLHGRLSEVATMLIKIGDPDQALGNATAALIATAVLMDLTPTEVAQRLLDSCPEDDEWHETYLPAFLSE